MAEFVELNDETFSETVAKTKAGLIDYYATWCGACRMAAPMFKRVATEAGIELFKVDAEANPDARGATKIETLPTLALIKDGKIIASLSTTKEEGLKEFLKANGISW